MILLNFFEQVTTFPHLLGYSHDVLEVLFLHLSADITAVKVLMIKLNIWKPMFSAVLAEMIQTIAGQEC